MKYSAFICSLFIFLFIGVQSIFAQDYTMKGKVSDSNGPLVGASVVVKDNPAIGTMTDSDGMFTIKVSRGSTLLFSYLGYKDVEYLVTKQEQNLDIKFTESATEVEEVVVTALGTQRKISTLSAVTSVDVNDLQQPV